MSKAKKLTFDSKMTEFYGDVFDEKKLTNRQIKFLKDIAWDYKKSTFGKFTFEFSLPELFIIKMALKFFLEQSDFFNQYRHKDGYLKLLKKFEDHCYLNRPLNPEMKDDIETRIDNAIRGEEYDLFYNCK